MSIWEAFGKGRYKGFSREAGLLLDEAVELAGGLGCKKADTGHLLLAMLQTDHGPAAKFLAGKNISELAVRRQLGADREGPALHLDRKALAPDLKRAMDYALIGAQNAHLAKAEPEHLLCAMLEDTDCAAGVLLASMGVQLAEAVRECRQLSGQFILPLQPRAASAMPRGSRASDKYCRDLTRRAADGELDPVFCREKELDRMVEILCRRQKNNPCLVGEPGVGRLRWQRGWPSALPTKMCPGCCRGGGCWRWIWPAWWQAPSTGAILKSALKTCWKNLSGMAARFCLWTSSTPSWGQELPREPLMRPAS